MKKFVLLWSVILAIALVGSAFAIDSSELRSPKLAKSATFSGDRTVFVLLPPPQCCQEVIPPEGSWNFITSDTDLGYTVFDNYICDYAIGEITFQGLDLEWAAGWYECDEDPMDFYIKFYPDVGAYPDTANPVCGYTVTPTRTATGILYGGFYELIEYSIVLPQPCSQTEGWLSIQGVGNGQTCVFLWGASTDGDGLAYQRYPDGSMTQHLVDLTFCMAGGAGVSMSCENLTPVFCRGKNIYFIHTVTNSTAGPVSGNMTFAGYAGYGCSGSPMVTIVRNKTYPVGVTSTYYYFKVPNAAGPGQYSVAITGTLGGFALDCCMDFDCIQCGQWRSGGNTEWSLHEVERPEVELPTFTSLDQNYPNPFNANTNISFSLAEAGNVSLNVYDITGRLVVTLVDGQMDAGQHVVAWDASSVSSGVYFYKLTAGDYTATKPMNLLK